MSRLLLLFIAGAFGSGLVFNLVDAAEDPTPDPAGQLKRAERELAELEQTIQARQTELADLKAKADGLRQRVVALKEGGNDTRTSFDKLVAKLPETAWPKDFKDTIRTDRANDWLNENVRGRRLEVKCSVIEVSLKRDESKHYDAWIKLTEATTTIEKEKVRISVYNSWLGSQLWFSGLSEASAEKLEQFKGKEITISGKVKTIKLSGQLRDFGDSALFSIELGDPRIDGFSP